jgi:serine/threonine protein phosphatase 1
MPRTIAIGDIHGWHVSLEMLLRQLEIQESDTIITLGDYVDYGYDTKETIELLIRVSEFCKLIPILGNHDEMMLQARHDASTFENWLKLGGIATLQSYGDSLDMENVPQSHFDFLESCLPYYENETHFFVHASYDPELPLDQQSPEMLRYTSINECNPAPHKNGKIAVVGHSPEYFGVMDFGYLIRMDTGCGLGGELSAMEIYTKQIWREEEQRAEGDSDVLF